MMLPVQPPRTCFILKMFRMKLNAISIFVIASLLTIGIKGECRESYFGSIKCTVNCFKDALLESEQAENTTFISIFITGSSCEPIGMDVLSARFPNLIRLEVSASSCPFRNFEFFEDLSSLEVLNLRYNGNRSEEEVTPSAGNRVEYKQKHESLITMHFENLCCQHFWDTFEGPNLDNLSVNCPNMQTIVSGIPFKNVKTDKSHKYIYASELNFFESKTNRAPDTSFTLSNLDRLQTVKLWYSVSKTVSLPVNFLYNITFLTFVEISGLTSMGKSNACEKLGAKNVMSVDVRNSSYLLFHSCKELLQFGQDAYENMIQTITYSDANMDKYRNRLFPQKKINATIIHFNNVPMRIRFPANQLDRLDFLEFDNHDQKYAKFSDLDKFLEENELHKFTLRVNSCDKEFAVWMARFMATDNLLNLQVLCKSLICEIDDGKTYQCQLPRPFELTEFNYQINDIENECMRDGLKCSEVAPKIKITTVKCIGDLLKLSAKTSNGKKSLSVRIKETACEKVKLKTIGEKFPNLEVLNISASGCPFEDLISDGSFPNLKMLNFKHDRRTLEETHETTKGYNETFANLESVSFNNLCCGLFWTTMNAPKLNKLGVNCPNMQTLVSGTPFKVVPLDEKHRYIHAANLVTYESSTREVPNLSNVVSDLDQLQSMRLEYTAAGSVKLAENFLRNLTALSQVSIKGLKAIQESNACKELGANGIVSVTVTQTSPTFFYSCPEILENSKSSEQTLHFTNSTAILGEYFPQNAINSSEIIFSGVPMNMKFQFPRGKLFNNLKTLKYTDVQESDVSSIEIRNLMERFENLENLTVLIDSCDKNLVNDLKMTKKVEKTKIELIFACKNILCQIEKDEKRLCKIYGDDDPIRVIFNVDVKAICADAKKTCKKIPQEEKKSH